MSEHDVPEEDRERYRAWEDEIDNEIRLLTGGQRLVTFLGYHWMNEYWLDADKLSPKKIALDIAKNTYYEERLPIFQDKSPEEQEGP